MLMKAMRCSDESAFPDWWYRSSTLMVLLFLLRTAARLVSDFFITLRKFSQYPNVLRKFSLLGDLIFDREPDTSAQVLQPILLPQWAVRTVEAVDDGALRAPATQHDSAGRRRPNMSSMTLPGDFVVNVLVTRRQAHASPRLCQFMHSLKGMVMALSIAFWAAFTLADILG
ncbi:hypothetical protein JFK97_00225 [Chromobacterium phragmitis]|uniref:hypothetical protein n=1 Tax=Chromobacterium amazonense TaxID=1382803 RepID=UPI0021B8454C|nr:hypothetical protein [Chromobacterium amazonense]MBM2882817.1 hypothetical protein [Chromobacterium amazonense]